MLRKALLARKAGNSSAVELAEARQAANDCNGWLQRLMQLLGSDGRGHTTSRSKATSDAVLEQLPAETKAALQQLQQEMGEVHRTFQASKNAAHEQCSKPMLPSSQLQRSPRALSVSLRGCLNVTCVVYGNALLAPLYTYAVALSGPCSPPGGLPGQARPP